MDQPFVNWMVPTMKLWMSLLTLNLKKRIKVHLNKSPSLTPTLDPFVLRLIPCFEELNDTIGIITETWLSDGVSLDQDVRDLASGAGLGMVCLNRKSNDRGVAQGGVAIVNNNSAFTLTKIDLTNPGEFSLSNIQGYSRKLLTVACYLLANYTVQRGKEALGHIEDVVLELKRRYKDPFMIVGGDLNQWAIDEAL